MGIKDRKAILLGDLPVSLFGLSVSAAYFRKQDVLCGVV